MADPIIDAFAGLGNRRQRHAWRHPDMYQAKALRTAAGAKRKLFDIYGHFCALCGETDEAVLQFDHICPRLRKRNEWCGPLVLVARLRSGRESPFNVQVLCANCHARKTKTELTFGYHERHSFNIATPGWVYI
jgi:5-methylcytosine-specific restriction endonuclease McrA